MKKGIIIITFLLPVVIGYGQTNNNTINVKTWSNNYEKLPFWNKEISHRGDLGYIDTFTINGTHFRIIHNDTVYDGTLQVYNGDKWLDNIKFESLGNHNDYEVFQDLDGDGNKDLIFYWKWYGEVYLYDNQKNRYSDSPNSTISVDWATISHSKHIYYENQFGKLIKSPVYSNLFTFIDKERIELAKLEMYFENRINTKNSSNLKKCLLYVPRQKKSIERFIVTEKVEPQEYKLEKYWKSKLKKIIGYNKAFFGNK